MIEQLQYFHFLRPFWMITVPLVLLLWWRIRPQRRTSETSTEGIAPHLAKALHVGEADKRRIYPIDGVAVAAVLLAFAAAGPAWSRLPNPLVAETAPLVIAIKVTESMETPDLAPTRLDRARFKVLDLIAERAGARTALVAYAGTAHRVAPLTEDPNILRPLLEGLSPQVMPVEGANASEALALSSQVLADTETPGAILFVLDDLDPTDIAAFDAERPPVVFLVAAPDRVTVPQLDRIADATVVRISPDDGDINQIERNLRSAHQAALAEDDRLQWDDRGWLFAWPAALLALIWFRQGWTMRWAIALALLPVLNAGPARADGWIDWFLTPDQQGYLLYQDKKFAEAGDVFEDPMWSGYTKFRAGQYEDAAAIFAGLDTADAAFAEGMARIRSRDYRGGARAFETALVRQPDFPEAEANREIAWAIVDYVERTREQSDTGESGIGADDVVFDNESGRGADTQIEAPSEDSAPLTTEAWMRGVDTQMDDFLRTRFLLENANR